MHSVLSGLFIPNLPLPNLHISIHVAVLQSEISQTTFLSFIDFFITRTECHLKFPYFRNKIYVFLSFLPNLNLRRLIQRKKHKHSPQIVSLLLTDTPTMGNTSSSLLSPYFLFPPLDPTLPPFSVTSLNVQSLNLSGEIFASET